MSAIPYRTTDPSTGEVVTEFDHLDDVEGALARADEAYRSWSERTIEDRAAVVQRLADLCAERADELARLARLEMGKPVSEGVEEAEFCRDIFGYFATEGPGLVADKPITTFAGGSAVVQHRPVGPILGIMPWNFPFYQVARFAGPNLVLGNTVLLKHAESVPQCALALQQIMDDAGVPAGVYQNVFATHEQIETIIADRRVQGVSLTGSDRAGAAVAALAGANLKKCVLELGGSDPFVVLDTESVDEVAGAAWDFRVANSGQVCNANKRMIVTQPHFEDFVAALVQRAEAVDEVQPMSSRAAAEQVAEQVQEAVDKGATLHAGGVLSDGPAAFYSPAVLTGVTKEMRAYTEELFGPVAVVYQVADEDEALALANDTVYGLGGSVFSADADRARRFAERLEVGMANVNTPAGEGAELPFGGVKRSGFGRELGPLGMDEFVNKRLLFVSEG